LTSGIVGRSRGVCWGRISLSPFDDSARKGSNYNAFGYFQEDASLAVGAHLDISYGGKEVRGSQDAVARPEVAHLLLVFVLLSSRRTNDREVHVSHDGDDDGGN